MIEGRTGVQTFVSSSTMQQSSMSAMRSPDHNQRMKYISALRTGYGHMSHKKSFLAIPSHFFEEENAVVRPVLPLGMDQDKETGKHGSLTNIFSCWNGMVGSGLVTIPWAYAQSGILLGLVLTVIAFVISFATQYFVMVTAGSDMDYTETLKKTFGKKGFYIGMSLFIMMLFIPIIIFFQLMAQFLFPVILFVIELFTGDDRSMTLDMDFGEFSYSWTCVLVFIIMFALTARKDLSIFIKINTFGVVFTMIIITFILVVGIWGLAAGGYTY